MTTVVAAACGKCEAPLDLQLVDWDPTMTPISQGYQCPSCKHLHTVQLPGKIVFVARRIVTRVPEPKKK